MRIVAYGAPVASLLLGLLAGALFVSGPEPAPARPAPVASPARPTPAPAPSPPAEEEIRTEGSGTIEGSVLTPEGRPVEGVVVVATRRPPSGPHHYYGRPGRLDAEGPPPADLELTATIRRVARAHRWRLSTRREAITGRDGRFEIRGLPDEYHSLDAFLPGHRVDGPDRRGGTRPGDEPYLFVARPVVRVPLEVTGPDGEPPAFAAISARGPGRESAGWTPERPDVELPPGEWTLLAQADGGRLESERVEVVVAAGATPEPVRLVLREPFEEGLHGSVAYPRASFSAFHQAVALELPAGADESPRRLLEEGVRDRIADGGYAFSDLMPGRYLVGVVRSEREVLASEVILYTGGDRVLDFVVPGGDRPEDGQIVRVLGPDGRPVRRAQVAAYVETKLRGRQGLGRAERVGAGEFLLLVPSGEAKQGECTLRVSSPEFGVQDLPYDPTGEDGTEVLLEAPAFVTVKLAPYAESRYEHEVRIGVVRPGEEARFSFLDAPPAPDGTQRFGPYQPGTYEVVAASRNPFSSVYARRTMEIVSGEQEVTLPLPDVFTLTVPVESEEAARGFYLEPIDGKFFRNSPTPYENGAIRFERVPPGWYLLCRHAGPRERMPVTIEGDTTIRFRPIPFDARWVVVSDPEGTLARAGLRTDDLVVAIDGEEITGERQGYALQRAAEGRGSAVFTVLRNGERIDFEVDTKGLEDPKTAGGVLKAWFR